MNLAPLECQIFRIKIRLAAGDFRDRGLAKELPTDAIDRLQKGQTFSAICNRRTKRVDYHAHVYVRQRIEQTKSRINEIEIAMYPGGRIAKKEPPPSAEEVFTWVDTLIKPGAKLVIEEFGGFGFPRSKCASVFRLPLPLIGISNPTGDALLEGSLLESVRIAIRKNSYGLRWVQHFVTEREVQVGVDRRIEGERSRLRLVAKDLEFLRNIAIRFVRRKT